MLNFSFALNHALGGLDVRGYHLANLAIHLAAALTLLGLVRRTLLTDPLRARFGAAALPLATAAALLWALHPLQTAAITYVSQRAESLLGLFYFLTLYCFVRGVTCHPLGDKSPISSSNDPATCNLIGDKPPGGRLAWLAASVASCLLGVGTKEIIVTAPLVVLLYDRTFLAGSFRDAWQQRRGLYVGLVAACALVAFSMRGIEARGVAAEGVSPLQYALIECRVIVGYLKLIVWPNPLVFDYGEFASDPAASALCALLLVPLLVATLVALVRRPVLGFVGTWFFLVLAPTSSVVPVTFQPMGEHRLYVPLAALAVTAVVGAYAVQPRRFVPPLLLAATACLALTAARNVDYRDPLRLWAGTLALRPDNYRAQNEYALSLAMTGRTDDAIASMNRTLARRPAASSLQRSLALVLMRAGRVAEALPHFEQVVTLEPKFIKGRQEYARALATVGQFSEAIVQVRAGIELLPESAGPHLELGGLLLQTNQPAAALAEFEAAVHLEPNDAHARNELGSALQSQGRDADALAQFEAGLRLAPENPTLLVNLGRALVTVGRPGDALPHLTKLVRLQPASAEAHFALANTLAALNRFPDALAEYDRTLRLDPNLPQAREFYELIRARTPR